MRKEWHDFHVRKEIVKRKGEPSVELTFYENDNGVIERDDYTLTKLDDGLYLARYRLLTSAS